MQSRLCVIFLTVLLVFNLHQVTIESSTLTCPVNSSSINLEIASSNHSGWAPAQNCSLVACTWISLSMSSNCSPPTIPCFQYQTANNTIYCAPAASCSVMEPCDINGQCSLLTSVCVINTCCNPSSVCLPLVWTNLCQSTVPPTTTIATPTSNMSSVWLFDGDFRDAQGILHGTGINNVTFVSPGISGHGSALATSQNRAQYVSISNYRNLTYTSFTVQMWFYATVLASPDNALFSQEESRTNYRSLHYVLRNNYLFMAFYGSNTYTTGQTLLTSNTWYHVAFVYDYSLLEQRVYLNGVEDGRASPIGPYQGTSGSLNIGMATDRGVQDVFTGYIDQVALVMRAKTAVEILEEATLITWHSFDHNPFRDSGPNAINSTSLDVTRVPGRVSQALNFTSNSSFYQVNGLVLLGFYNQPFSFALWVNPRSTNGGTLIRLQSVFPYAWCLDMMGLTASGQIVAVAWNTTLQQVIGPILMPNTWTHLVSTYSPLNGVRLYVNGTFTGTTGPLNFHSPNQTNILTLGHPAIQNNCSRISIIANTFEGYLDEFRVYSRELNATDISILANP